MILTPYAELFRDPGPWCTAYVDVTVGSVDSRQAGDVRSRNAGRELSQLGASDEDVEAVAAALEPATGEPGPASRLLLVRRGSVLLDEVLPEDLDDAEVQYGPVPDITPLIRHRQTDFSYVLVQIGHDGGEISLRTATGQRVQEQQIEGSTENIKKIPGGGLSQGQYQHRTEEVWRHNANEVAQRVDAIVNGPGARLIIVAGDEQSRPKIIDQLSEGSQTLVVTMAENPRSAGTDDAEFEALVERRVAEEVAEQESAVLEQIAVQEGQTNPLSASGLGSVVSALQAAQVSTLVFDEEVWSDHRLLVLDKEPWVATSDEQTLDARVLGEVPAPAALVRAAALTGAEVMLVPTGALADGRDIAALLRWETGPMMPESAERHDAQGI